MSTNQISNLIYDLKSKGYDTIELYDVELPTDKTKSRAMSRFAETGRFLAPSYLDSVGDLPSKTFEQLKNKEGVTYYAKYDNDVNFKEKAKLIENGGKSITERGENNFGENNRNLGEGQERPVSELGGRNGEIENVANSDFLNAENEHKQKQLEIIQEFNPKDPNLGNHTWIESVDDIHTFDEVANLDEDLGLTPDFTTEDVKKALETGENAKK